MTLALEDRPAIFCYGAGAIGGLIAARLDQAGFPVGLVARGEALEVMRSRGLVLLDDDRRSVVRLKAFESSRQAAEALGPPLAVILTVKAYDVASAVDELAASLGESSETLVLCLQNGIGSEEAVALRMKRGVVWAGAITLSVERTGPGEIRILTRHGGLALGPFLAKGVSHRGPSEPFSPGAMALVSTLREAGFRVVTHSRGDSVKWSKALLNLWANASSAVFDQPPSAVVADPELFRLDWLAFKEALTVMKKAGIAVVDLPGYPVRLLAGLGHLLPEWLFRRCLGSRVAGGRGGKMPSFWLDLQAGRGRSEVTHLNGAVAGAARRLGLRAPANEGLTAALTALASRQVTRDHFTRHPSLVLKTSAEAAAR